MKSYIIGILSFIGGAAVSGIATWKLVEKKCEEKYKVISDEEIKSVKEKFTVPKVELKKEEAKDILKQAINKPSLTEIAKQITKPYTNYSNTPEPENRKDTLPWDEERKPHVIKPDEYGENEAYDQVELTLYADGILADDKDDIVESEVVGDALEHIGEYDDDVVHVCDPVKKTYYEILTDNRSYEDATGKEPPKED